MTVKESLEQILDRLPDEEQRQVLDFAEFLRWRQEQGLEPSPKNGLNQEGEEELQAAQKVANLSLPNAKLKALAAKHQPPQSWFDEDDKPF
jgi:septal ring factor EnvC (AmiA/AmiB activator)